MIEPLFRDQPATPVNVQNCAGNYIFDKKGKRYLDFMMGWCVGNIGWNKKILLQAIKKYNGPSYVVPTYIYDQWNILAKKLVSLMPNRNYSCFRATGGTESVELALKISKAYNKRKKFIAFENAYHGQSLACLSLVGTHENNFGPYGGNFIRLNTNWQQASETALKEINSGDVSAFISEPILCNLGVIVPPKDFFASIKEACEKTDTVFIMDEVATGFGRTGKFFGFEHYNVKPDIVTIAKGFSSGYAPIGAAIANEKVAESMRFGFSNYSTFGWHPMAVHCALKNMQYLTSSLIRKSNKTAKILMDKLSEFCEPEGKGLCLGFTIKNKNLEQECLKDGLLISVLGDRAVIFPALDVSEKEIEKAVEIIRKNY